MTRYVCSDIHGQYSLFLKALDRIGFSESDHMYIIGDVIDRGPDSMALLRDVMRRKNVTLLLGNHEYMMIQYLRRHRDGRPWTHTANGGEITLAGYSLLSDAEKREVRAFLEGLCLQIETKAGEKTFLLSHSSFLRDHGTVKWMDVPDASGVVWDSPWRTWEYIDPAEYSLDGREHIIGHVPTILIPDDRWPDGIYPSMPSIYRDRACRITNIDCGCALIPRMKKKRFLLAPGADCGLALCILDLDRFAADEPDAIQYFPAEIWD